MYKLTYSLLTIDVHSVVTMALFSTISEIRRLICRKLRFFVRNLYLMLTLNVFTSAFRKMFLVSEN